MAATARRIAAVLLGLGACAALAATPRTTHFPSADGRTELVAYLFEPSGPGPHPAVVMLHGRAGPYSSNVAAGCALVAPDHDSPCNASTLSRRHAMWGEYWAAHGYVALLVDSFGPRGRGHGYGRFTHDDPDREAVNELTVRPLDAEGALAWLRTRADVVPGRVMLQGWSNGGSTALNTMYRQAIRAGGDPAARFGAALVFYPGCGPRALLSARYVADVPVWAFLGSDDEEVSPATCEKVLRAARGGPVQVTVFDGATHDFDDPGAARQSVPANRAARNDGRAIAIEAPVIPIFRSTIDSKQRCFTPHKVLRGRELLQAGSRSKSPVALAVAHVGSADAKMHSAMITVIRTDES